MSVDAIYSKRERRQWEPEEKTWNDEALKLPWEEITPPLHSTTIFSLKNIFFFSHATPIQAEVLKCLTNGGNSAIIEAPTGSGKTLAFLIPLMERTIRMGEKIAAETGRPPLTRQILGIIISPSRALAEQTYVVGKRLAARFPFNVQFALCDGVIESASSCYDHLKKCSRGVGSYIVTTPNDLSDFLSVMENREDHLDMEVLDELDEKTKMRYLARQKHQFITNNSHEKVHFYSSALHRFLFIIDEADLVFQYDEMKGILHHFIDSWMFISSSEEKKRKRNKNDGDKLVMDFFFIGATVSVSTELETFVRKMCQHGSTTLHKLQVKGNDDFLSELSNRYVVCDSNNFLAILVQLINGHAAKKHFVFFNSARSLLFVKQLFSRLAEGSRPILFVKNIFVMYEGMSENARMEQYNKFLTHNANVLREQQKLKDKHHSESEGKNQFFASGLRRSGKPKSGYGAILLCTNIAAFGLDVRDVDYVYHFEPPSSVKTYVHRIGRVGRMGMKGCSILLLPCCSAENNAEAPRERKTTSNRFNTVTNTKMSTAHLQKNLTTLSDLPEEQSLYMEELSKTVLLTEYILPPTAPISSTLRNIIQEDAKMLKLARSAAMSMCQSSEEESCWFYPRLAVESLLINI